MPSRLIEATHLLQWSQSLAVIGAGLEVHHESVIAHRRPAHLDEREALVQQGLHLRQRFHPADVRHRDGDRVAHAPGLVQEELGRVAVVLHHDAPEQRQAYLGDSALLLLHHLLDRDAAPQHVERGAGGEAARGHQCGRPGRLERLGHRRRVVHVEAAPPAVADVHLDEEGEVRPHGRAHRGDHLHGEAQPVLGGAPVAVGAPVGPGGEELAEQVAVAGVQLHGVEAGVAGHDGAPGEVGDLVGDIGLGHGAAERGAEEAELGRRPDRPSPDHPRAGEEPAVAQLDGRRRALGVHGLGEAAQPGHDVGAHPELMAERTAVVADGAVGQGGHPDAAGRDAPVVLDEPVGDHAALGKALEASRPHHPVAERQTREGQRGEDCACVGVRWFHSPRSAVGSRVFGTISQGAGPAGRRRTGLGPGAAAPRRATAGR